MTKKKGFTLVELLVVIAILAILATVSVVGYTSFIKKAKASNALTELTQIRDLMIANDIDDDLKYDEYTAGTKIEKDGEVKLQDSDIVVYTKNESTVAESVDIKNDWKTVKAISDVIVTSGTDTKTYKVKDGYTVTPYTVISKRVELSDGLSQSETTYPTTKNGTTKTELSNEATKLFEKVFADSGKLKGKLYLNSTGDKIYYVLDTAYAELTIKTGAIKSDAVKDSTNIVDGVAISSLFEIKDTVNNK